MAWIEALARDIEPKETTPYIPTLYTDNQSGIDQSHNAKFHDKSKHIEVQYFFIQNDMVRRNRLNVTHVPGKNNPADVLIKQLSKDDYLRHLKALGMARDLF